MGQKKLETKLVFADHILWISSKNHKGKKRWFPAENHPTLVESVGKPLKELKKCEDFQYVTDKNFDTIFIEVSKNVNSSRPKKEMPRLISEEPQNLGALVESEGHLWIRLEVPHEEHAPWNAPDLDASPKAWEELSKNQFVTLLSEGAAAQTLSPTVTLNIFEAEPLHTPTVKTYEVVEIVDPKSSFPPEPQNIGAVVEVGSEKWVRAQKATKDHLPWHSSNTSTWWAWTNICELGYPKILKSGLQL